MQKVLLIHQRVEMVVMEEIQLFQQKLQRAEVEVVALIVVAQEVLVVQVEGAVDQLLLDLLEILLLQLPHKDLLEELVMQIISVVVAAVLQQ